MSTCLNLALIVPIIAFWTGCFFKINEIQQDVYMDEIFHVPQAQVFCKMKNLTWNPKITTLPGLYLISSGILTPISKLYPSSLCSVFQLRLISFLFNLLNVYLIAKILFKLHRKTETEKLQLTALTISSLPVLTFSSFLYYTDTFALFCVLLMYILHLHGNNGMAGIVGFISVAVRQTNIIWVFMIALNSVMLECERSCKQQIGQNCKSFYQFICSLIKLAKKPYDLATLICHIVCSTYTYILTGISFICFLIINGSIVVGDKSAHEAEFNAPQFGYFLTFTLVSAIPHLVSIYKLKHFLVAIRRNIFIFLFLTTTSYLLVQNYTVVHPYTLADNRHVTFYVWKWFFRKYWFAQYLYIGVYIYAAYAVNELVQNAKFTWKVTFFICVALATIPQKMLEFRYFIIPYVLLRIQMRSWCRWKILAELILSAVCNGIVVYFFLFKSFKWPDSNDAQRFMW